MTLVPLLLWLAVVLPVCAWLAWRLYYFEPRPWRPLPPPDEVLGRLGGWLYVLFPAMALGPLVALAPLIGSARWVASFIAAGEISASPQVSVGEVTVRIVVSIAQQALLFGGWTVMSLLFFRRRRSFPWVLCGVVALRLILELFQLPPSHWTALRLRPPQLASFGEILASGGLWVAYLRFSSRAAATFVVPAPPRPRGG